MPHFKSASPFVRPSLQGLQRVAAQLAMGIGLVLSGWCSVSYSGTALANPPVQQNLGSALADGIYLFGRSPQPDQIGAEYLVFEVRGQHTVGAFYMPSSSFDCFHGEVQPDRLLLNIMGSYDQPASDYAIALQPESNLSASELGAIAPASLAGYYEISNLSQGDRNLLATCQQADPQPRSI
ncbi:MAG: hypothetical protein HC873_00710 [Leptolyngbyaceae cyanobacterium SL_1_1]|nr:hypothetical protein [Leptolyngbyaceae cyanobacterium RM1_1_2]NJO08398.1 hypothetical protein [Leptolyngbyaceae cyanobacterium SL_1_1]